MIILYYTDDEELTTPHYSGEVGLCPSDGMIANDNASNTITSISSGVVSLHLNNQWRGINQASGSIPLGGNEADAICRQMGYTHAAGGSALARVASSYTFTKC